MFYGILPFMLLTVLFASGFAGHTVAAPGEITNNELVQFEIPSDAPDPNETFRLVNEARATQNIAPLIANETLGKIAKARAMDMVARSYYAHKDPDGKYYYDYFKSYNLSTGYNCENLDLVFVPNQNQVISEWNSSLRGHRECMTSTEITHAGYATARANIISYDGTSTVVYLVVAIHAAL